MKLLIMLLQLPLFVFGGDRYLVEMKNGDYFIGTPELKKYLFKTEYGVINAGLNVIRRIEFIDKSLKLTLTNNDKIVVKSNIKTFPLHCELGKVNIPMDKIHMITHANKNISDFKMKWSEIKAGLICGISLDRKVLKKGETLKVKVIVKNVSSSSIELGRLTFSKEPLRKNEDYNTIGLIMPTLQMIHVHDAAFAQRISRKPLLLPQAELIFEFDVKGDWSGMEQLKMHIEEEAAEIRDIKKTLHFKQNLTYKVHTESETTVQFRYKLNDKVDILSPKIKLELQR